MIKRVILSRVACLGHFTLRNLSIKNSRLVNHQKNRCDYAVLMHQNQDAKINLPEVKKFIAGNYDYILSLLEQEQSDIFSYAEEIVGGGYEVMLIMDSFSELTDKMFLSLSSPSRFLAHWRDINHTEEFEKLYRCTDLLPIDEIKKCYDDFFAMFVKTYGKCPILFLNFPTNLDAREEYKERGRAIAAAIDELAKTKYDNIIAIKADVVEPNPTDDAVYHFSEKTYKMLAKKIEALGFAGISFSDYEKRRKWLKIARKIKLLAINFIPCAEARRRLRKKIRMEQV